MKNLKITVNGTSYDVQVEEMDASAAPAQNIPEVVPTPIAAVPARKQEENKQAPTEEKAAIDASETVNAPMPGTIVSVHVTAGQKVAKGDVLVILEAMKMENEIMSPRDAVVADVNVSKGENVNSGTPLISLK